MMLRYEKRSHWKGIAVTVALFVALVGVFVFVLRGTSDKADTEQATLLETAIRNAAVTSYANEGRYPETLEKIVEQYGIIIDESRFLVRYDVFGSNVMPSITIINKEEVTP